jgi:hypothetical protein
MDMFFHVKIQLQKFSDCDMDLTYVYISRPYKSM